MGGGCGREISVARLRRAVGPMTMSGQSVSAHLEHGPRIGSSDLPSASASLSSAARTATRQGLTTAETPFRFTQNSNAGTHRCQVGVELLISLLSTVWFSKSLIDNANWHGRDGHLSGSARTHWVGRHPAGRLVGGRTIHDALDVAGADVNRDLARASRFKRAGSFQGLTLYPASPPKLSRRSHAL